MATLICASATEKLQVVLPTVKVLTGGSVGMVCALNAHAAIKMQRIVFIVWSLPKYRLRSCDCSSVFIC